MRCHPAAACRVVLDDLERIVRETIRIRFKLDAGGSSGTESTESVTSSVRERLWKNATSRTTPSEIDVQHRVVKLRGKGHQRYPLGAPESVSRKSSQLSGRFAESSTGLEQQDLHVQASGEGTDLVFQARGWRDDVLDIAMLRH